MSSSAFREVSERGPAHPAGPGLAHPCPKQQPQSLGMAEIHYKKLSAPSVQLKHSGLLLGVGKEAGKEEGISFFFLRRVIFAPGEHFFMAELRDCSQGWGRREQRCHKSPPGSFHASECSYERWSRFAQPCLIVQKFDLGKEKKPQTT